MSPVHMETDFTTALATGGDAESVATRAAAQAYDDLGSERVDFCQVFVSSAFDHCEALESIRSVIGEDVPLIGCSSTGEFTEQGSVDSGIAISLVTSDTIEFHTGIGTGLKESVSRAVRDSLSTIPETVEGYPYRSAVQLHDGLQGVSERLTLVTQRKLGPRAQFAGGAAADNFQLESTPVFCDDVIAENAVSIATMDTKNSPAVSVNHGHEPITEPLEVTSSEGSFVSEINGVPAYEAWLNAVREPAAELFGIDIDQIGPGSPAHQQMTAVFCFGIDQGEGYKIRWFQVPDPTTQGLHFSVNMPEGVMLHVMQGTKNSQINSARGAAQQANESIETEYAGAFIYDCAARDVILGDKFGSAVEAIDSELSTPFIGYNTFGEVCMRMGGVSGYHNTSTVVQLLPK